MAGKRDSTPDAAHIALAEELLVRLELDDVAVRLNLLGQPGEQPDFVVASWVLPYVYALRGDRDWRRSPQLTGSRQVSQLAVQAYKLLEAGDTTIGDLKHGLGREVTEAAVLRAITELWQQLRIVPVISAPGKPAKWQLLRLRFQKAIAEGASTSQVTAISVLASIYLQAVIAASMEEVELFLAPLTARSKIREVLRGLVATRQVHTIPLGHSPHFYVAGTLPEFTVAPTLYASSSMSSSAYFLRTLGHEDEALEPQSYPSAATAPAPAEPSRAPEAIGARPAAVHKPASSAKPPAPRPHFSRPPAHSRDRKPAQSSSSSRTARRPISDSRTPAARPAGSRSASGSRPGSVSRWTAKGATATNGSRNGAHAGNGNGSGNGSSGGARPASGSRNGKAVNGAHGAKPTPTAWSPRNGHSNGAKTKGKSAGAVRNGAMVRKDARADARPARSGRKPALTAGAKAGNSKRFGFTARPKQGSKKRG